mgnify:FL=1
MNETTTGGRRLLGWFPTLDRDERHELYERILLGAADGPDFYIMMFLAATLASLGLLQGSTAVVIGAMLVAPLMGPLVGAGLALEQGNLPLLHRAFRVALKGTLLGLAVSVLFGLANHGYEPTMEIEARGRPDLFDLFVALASGMVAAYAQGRPNVSGTLAGVAIAAALLPPLAVVGIALTAGHTDIAANARVLLITNLVAIVLGAALVFRLLGVRARGDVDSAMPAWARRTFAGLIMIAVILAAPLLLKGMEKNRAGQVRPISFPVSSEVRDAVKQFVASKQNLRLLTMGREGIEPGAKIIVLLTTTGPIVGDFHAELRQLIHEVRTDSPLDILEDGDDPWVRIFILEEARIQAAG